MYMYIHMIHQVKTQQLHSQEFAHYQASDRTGNSQVKASKGVGIKLLSQFLYYNGTQGNGKLSQATMLALYDFHVQRSYWCYYFELDAMVEIVS